MQAVTCIISSMENRPDPDSVFRGLADHTRREVLDRLRVRDGQSLGELCDGVGMARQSLTQHVDVLVDAGLVTVVRSGRLRLHFLNPEPIHRIKERWISTFDEPRLAALAAIRGRAEERALSELRTTTVPDYVYVTYIRAGIEQVWQALTDADLTARYWAHRNTSTWQEGDIWRHESLAEQPVTEGIGRVLECAPPTMLKFTFESPEEFPGESPSVVTFTLEPGQGITRLSVVHENLADEVALGEISHGWSAVLSNLKSLLETGDPLPQEPWSMNPVAVH